MGTKKEEDGGPAGAGAGAGAGGCEEAAADVVVVDWDDVVSDSSSNSASGLHGAFERALGPRGIGLVAIRGVPGFVEAKASLLPMAHALASLPQDYLETELADEASLYNAGWSHGKEKLGDKPDFAKASYYYNPVTDRPGTDEDRGKYPLSYPANVWPSEDVLPGFKAAAKNLGNILFETVVGLTKHLDQLAAKKLLLGEEASGGDGASGDDAAATSLYDTMNGTDKVKARLLYYYPLKEQQRHQPKSDSWIGWHNDSGFLTALAGDIYVEHGTGKILDRSPDPDSGLYVVDRHTKSVLQVKIPADCVAVQIGECTQIVTGNTFTATPHCVRGIAPSGGGDGDVARISLACFVDSPPGFELKLPRGCTRRQVLDVVNPKVPPLDGRWTHDGMTFGDFLHATFSRYYDWNDDDGGGEGKEEEEDEDKGR